MAIHIDKEKLRKETIEKPKRGKKYKRGAMAAAVIGTVLGWEWTARSFTDYWNSIRQVQTIN